MTTITDANLAQTLDLSKIDVILPEIAQSIVEYPTQDDFPQTGRSARDFPTCVGMARQADVTPRGGR